MRYRRHPSRLSALITTALLASTTVSGAWAQSSDNQGAMRALLAPHTDATLSSQMEGTLSELPVSLGVQVAEGDTLARFDCRIEQARVNVAIRKN